MRGRPGAVGAAAVALAVVFLLLWGRNPPLPAGLGGALVFVSDRTGVESLYLRHLPRGSDRRITATTEPVREPRFSPDGKLVAFAMGGRIGVVTLESGQMRVLTLGVDWRDASPAWRPDGKGLVVSARRRDGANAGLHLLEVELPGAEVARHPLTQTRGLDDTMPVFAPDGLSVVFVREDNLFRVALADGRTTRLTGSFRRYRSPRFLPSGRLAALWQQEKSYGIDVMDADGKNRETLAESPVFYRTLAPAPDGRHFVATFTFDLGFHPSQALRFRQTEEVRLLDTRGREQAVLEQSWRHTNHSPDWGK